MEFPRSLWIFVLFALPAALACAADAPQSGGKLVIALRAEPKTLNPLTSLDNPSREVIARLNADLIRQNRATLESEAALAEQWKVSSDGRQYTIHLRHNLRFSDGHPFDADDVLFSLQTYLDERTNATQRDLLLVNGSPLQPHKLDQLTVQFNLPSTYATTERMFDGLAMLPRHLLKESYEAGKQAHAWTLSTPPSQIAGLGPFRLKDYKPGEHILLERNPYYWREGKPYLDQIEYLFVGDEDAQLARFLAGDTDIISHVSARNVPVLTSRGFAVEDAGPSLEYNFLFFNLTSKVPEPLHTWFRETSFRRAVSTAIDRESIVNLVYAGKATPLKVHVTPGNRTWALRGPVDQQANPAEARRILREAKFSWNREGLLVDPSGRQVEFTILSSSSNTERAQMATLIADDLKKIGITAHVVNLEFRSMVDRVLKTFDYDAALMGLGAGDGDPNSEMNVWLSNGAMHLWNPGEEKPATAWEAEIDSLMRKQEIETNFEARRKMYWRVQEIEAEQLPIISLVSPHVLAARSSRVRNFHPVVMGSDMLWNADEIWVQHFNKGSDSGR